MSKVLATNMLNQLATWFNFLLFFLPPFLPPPIFVASSLADCCCRVAFLVDWLSPPFIVVFFVSLLSSLVLGISVFLGRRLFHRHSPPPLTLSPSMASDKAGPPCIVASSSLSSLSENFRLWCLGSPSSLVVVFVTGISPLQNSLLLSRLPCH